GRFAHPYDALSRLVEESARCDFRVRTALQRGVAAHPLLDPEQHHSGCRPPRAGASQMGLGRAKLAGANVVLRNPAESSRHMKPTYILGLNTFHADASAALLRDGELVAAVAEERLNRVKHFAGFPAQAVREVLDIAGIDVSQVDHIGINKDNKA